MRAVVRAFGRGAVAILSVVGKAVVRVIDYLLSLSLGVKVFTQDRDCILRVSIARALEDRVLSDGTAIHRGERVIDLHFWNERLPRIDPAGAQLAWAREFYSRFVYSLRLVSVHVDSDPRFGGFRAFHGMSAAMPAEAERGVERATRGIGFDFVWKPIRRDIWGRFAAFWENFYSCALIWVFNPGSLRTKRMTRLRRFHIWMSRERMRQRYGGQHDATPAPVAVESASARRGDAQT